MPTSVPPEPVRSVTSVFLPREHGSWSLVLEPMALGLLIAPSWAGGALAVAALAGFFSRRPLKGAFAATPSEKRRTAREALVMWSALAVAGLLEAGVLGGWLALWPLLPAACLGGLFVWCDVQNDSRELGAELAGSAAFAFVPATVATLAGQPVGVSLTLTILALTRSIPTILTVRAYLRTAKGESAKRSESLWVSVLALAALVGLAVTGNCPRLAVWLGGLFFARTAWLLGPWRPGWPARRVGQMEAGLGALYVVLLAATWPVR